MLNPLLSLCMIVKNEEERIAKCLKSVQDIVDEIIIVDTGSTDRTIEICKLFGCSIEQIAWENDFASARNHGIMRAKGEWILWLDADEVLEKRSRAILHEALKSNEYDTYAVQVLNYYGDQISEMNYSRMSQVRLFRNFKGYKFKNKIHETLNLEEMGKGNDQIGFIDLKIYHYGYMDDVVLKKEKSKRNITILEDELKKHDDGWIRFYLAAEYYREQRLQEAVQYVNSSIIRFIEKGIKPIPMVYKLKYSILTDMNCWEEAARGINHAILLYPDYVDLWFYKGLILYNSNAFQEAINSFQMCINLGEENIQYYVVKGVGSYQALFYIGICYEQLGCTEKAIAYFLKSLDSSMLKFEKPLHALSSILESKPVLFQQYVEKNMGVELCKKTLQMIRGYLEK